MCLHFLLLSRDKAKISRLYEPVSAQWLNQKNLDQCFTCKFCFRCFSSPEGKVQFLFETLEQSHLKCELLQLRFVKSSKYILRRFLSAPSWAVAPCLSAAPCEWEQWLPLPPPLLSLLRVDVQGLGLTFPPPPLHPPLHHACLF